MKTNLLVLFLMGASALTALSQGTVVFNNLGGVRAPILIAPARANVQVQGQPTVVGTANSTAALAGQTAADYGAGAVGASGTGFTAELWAGADAGSLAVVPGSQTPLRTGSTAGYITQIATLAIPQIVAGSSGTMQVRAWNNVNGTVTSWASAMADDSIARGVSLAFVNATGGAGTPASAPATLGGFQSFNLFTPVPEPSVIALGVLGLGALLLRRRK